MISFLNITFSGSLTNSDRVSTLFQGLGEAHTQKNINTSWLFLKHLKVIGKTDKTWYKNIEEEHLTQSEQ